MAKQFTKGDFQPLPEGDYLVRMNRLVEEPTKNGKGVMVKAGFQVVNGDHKGRLIFHNFLVEHTSEKAAKVGNDQLNKYLQAVGVADGLEGIGHDRTQLEDYTELPFVATLKIEGEREYTAADGSLKVAKPRNKIYSFKAR